LSIGGLEKTLLVTSSKTLQENKYNKPDLGC